MTGIYKITNTNNKIYIGQSWDIEKREKSYRRKQCRGQRYIYSSILKYGWDSHKFEIIHELPNDITQNILDNYEFLYLESYRDCGVEVMNIKESGSHGKHSQKSKDLVSIKNRGKVRSEEFKRNVGEFMKGNKYSLGFKQSKETLAKKRVYLIGRVVSEETKEKIRNKLKGIKHSEERRLNISKGKK